MSDEPLSYVELSDMPMADADLAELARLTAAATPGPWEHVEGDEHLREDSYWWSVCETGEDNSGVPHAVCATADVPESWGASDDAAFIAAARSAVPRLLAALAASEARYAAALENGEQAQLAAEAAVELLKVARLWVYNANFDVGDHESEEVHVYYRPDVLAAIDAFLAERAAR